MKYNQNQKRENKGLESGFVPYARYQVEWHQVVPRKGSAFERMAVFAVDRLKDSELADDSLRTVFVNVLKVSDEVVDTFLDPALRDLLEYGTGALRLEHDGRAPEDSPIRHFELSDVGRELLRTGSIPCAEKVKQAAYLVDLRNGTVHRDRSNLRQMDEATENRYAPLVHFPQEAMERFVRENEIEDGSVSDLRSTSEPELVFGYDSDKRKKKKGGNRK